MTIASVVSMAAIDRESRHKGSEWKQSILFILCIGVHALSLLRSVVQPAPRRTTEQIAAAYTSYDVLQNDQLNALRLA